MSFNLPWVDLTPNYSQASMKGWVATRNSGDSNVTLTIVVQTQAINDSWWQSNHHIYIHLWTDAGYNDSFDLNGDGAGQSGYKEAVRTFTLNVGYGAGGTTVHCSTSQDWDGGHSTYQDGYLDWGATYTNPNNPSITGHTSSNGYQETYSFTKGDGGSAELSSCNIDRQNINDTDALFASGKYQGTAASSPYSITTSRDGAAIVSRIATCARSDGRWRFSGNALLLKAPLNPSEVQIKRYGMFGCDVSWKNNHDKTDYKTLLYLGGSVSVGSNGKITTSNSSLLASFGPGDAAFIADGVWNHTEGLNTKTFYLVQVSSYDAWKRSDKATLINAGKQYLLDGYASSVTKLTLENGAVPPQPATNISATNIFDNEASDTHISVSWSAVASTPSSPRYGWKVLINNIEVWDESDSAAGTKTADIVLSDSKVLRTLHGITGKVTVQAYGPVAPTNVIVDKLLYGVLTNPAKIDVNRVGRVLTASVTDGNVNDYAHQIDFYWSLDQTTWTKTDKRSLRFDGDSYTTKTMYFKARTVPSSSNVDVEQHASEYITQLCLEGTNSVASITAKQRNETAFSFCVCTWPEVLDGTTEMPDSYELYYVLDKETDQHFLTSVAANASSEYSYSFIWQAAPSITLYLYAKKNGYLSSPVTTTYQYVPRTLLPPTLLSISRVTSAADISAHTEYGCKILFRHSTGGFPWYPEDTSKTGYKYEVYVDGVLTDYQVPSSSTVFNTLTDGVMYIKVVSPKPVYIRMIAVDQKKKSSFSNSLSISYHATGVAVFAYGCDSLKISDCIIENASKCLKAVSATNVSMLDCDMSLSSGKTDYYDVDSDSSIFELNGTYGEG